MIDVQIVAGKHPEVVTTCLERLLDQRELVSRVLVANQTGASLPRYDPIVTVTDVPQPRTFEANHNALASQGDSEFILFLDDDAFIFPGALSSVVAKAKADPTILCASGTNNQTFRPPGPNLPMFTSLDAFLRDEENYRAYAKRRLTEFRDDWYTRVFCPGCFMLTRREHWQGSYGGWDESYVNWQEEVDYVLWGYERGLRTLISPGVFYVHLGSSSRSLSRVADSIAVSSRHFLTKFPADRLTAIQKRMRKIDLSLLDQLKVIIADASERSDPARVVDGELFRALSAVFESREADSPT